MPPRHGGPSGRPPSGCNSRQPQQTEIRNPILNPDSVRHSSYRRTVAKVGVLLFSCPDVIQPSGQPARGVGGTFSAWDRENAGAIPAALTIFKLPGSLTVKPPAVNRQDVGAEPILGATFCYVTRYQSARLISSMRQNIIIFESINHQSTTGGEHL